MVHLLPTLEEHILAAVLAINKGGVVAYPTEAVYGLGCSPQNEQAVRRLLTIKERPVEKGLILIAASFEQLKIYIDLTSVPNDSLNEALQSWPGPYTWVFPASPYVPSWIKGSFETIAVRVTNHPVAKALCLQYGGALVSTSANKSTLDSARSANEVKQNFADELDKIDYIIDGSLGNEQNPTLIRDVLTKKVYRAS